MRATKLLSGNETSGLKQIESSPRISPRSILRKNLVGIHSRLRQFVGRDVPDFGDMGPMFRVRQIACAGKLVTLLPMLASSLAIGLARDRRIAAVFAADASGGEHDVDRAQHVLHAVAVMFNAAGVH